MIRKRPQPRLPGEIARLLREHGGVLRTGQALEAGIHPRTLYELRDAGVLEQLSRGLYRFADAPPLSNPDLVTVALRVPQGVVCLISALAFHELTTQVPHEIQLALPRGAEPPRIEHPPVRTFWFTRKAFEAGIEVHQLDRNRVRIYSPEKTLVDCFKYRNKLGLDTALEALRFYKERRRVKIDALINFAKVCRVANVIRPYLEAVL
ncbi:MAG: transcriptional regulator [Planctomycetes bacterium]|nr:transcriptional regulator [Planctomycetota bacterium]